jgi:spore coat protein A
VFPFTRRAFLAGAVAVAGRAQSPSLHPESIAKFVDPLPIPPVAKKTGGTNHYRMEMAEVLVKVHRDLPATRMWGYNGSAPGPVIETRSGQSLSVEWVNRLPKKHYFPIDHNLHGAEKDKPEVRSVVHIHGAKTPPESDGYPEDWYEPGKSLTYHYPNNQESSTLWYHDHAMGINRLNIYAGLFGLFLIRDDHEDALNLPKGRYEIPLVIYDRSFRMDGSLDYPDSGMPNMPWVPEAFGEAMMVNGKLFPYLDVEPRRYRFRILNAANGRFFHLALSNRQKFFEIGTDQGLLPGPVELDNFVIAPGERYDLIVDFAGHDGESIVLTSDAFEIMQFRVAKTLLARDSSSLPDRLRAVEKTPETLAIKTRRIPLVELKSPNGDSMTMLLGGKHWDMPVTENPVVDTTEIWEFINTTDDSHPIHLHLVRFQILDRRSFDEPLFFRTNQIRYTGPVVAPEPHELGWKDTIRAHSRMITRIIVRFEGYTGRYVWHCHVLEHEDNEMMRPYDVLPK